MMKIGTKHPLKAKIILSFILAFVILILNVPQDVNSATLSTKALNWGYTKSKNHKTPVITKSTLALLKENNAYYVHDTNDKVIYLTFDLGYENGYTTKILDVLKKHKIKASFFVCKAFIDSNPKGLKRMVKEGHVVANHTVNHIAFYKLSEDKIESELSRVEAAYKKVTGKPMVKIVRPPEGGYSEKSLAITKELGYTTIFWSIALPNDWNMQDQPSKETTLALFKTQYHNGAIALLHGVSPAVANNLDGMLTELEKQGYEFRLVTDMAADQK